MSFQKVDNDENKELRGNRWERRRVWASHRLWEAAWREVVQGTEERPLLLRPLLLRVAEHPKATLSIFLANRLVLTQHDGETLLRARWCVEPLPYSRK